VRPTKARTVRQDFPGGGWIEPIEHRPDRPRLPFVVRFATTAGSGQEEGFPTLEEASLRHLQIRASAISQLPASARTVEEATTVFLFYHPKGSIRKTKGALKNHLLPLLGATKLVDVNESSISLLLDSLERTTSMSLQNQIARWFEKIMGQAVKLGWLPPDVTFHLPRRQLPHTRSKQGWLNQSKSRVKPSLASIELMLEKSADGGMVHILVLLGLRAGLRFGEIFALQWGEIDLDAGILRVRAAIRSMPLVDAEVGGENLAGRVEQKIRSAPKSQAAFRSIPIHPELKDALLAWKNEQCTEDDFVLFRPDDVRLSMSSVRNHFKRFLVDIGLATARRYITDGGSRNTAYEGGCRIHDLRHACVALWIWEGHDLQDIKHWIGHADLQTTLGIYGYLLEAYESGDASWPSGEQEEPTTAQDDGLIELHGQFFRPTYRPCKPAEGGKESAGPALVAGSGRPSLEARPE
jgi:integrase